MSATNRSQQRELLGILAPILLGVGAALADYHYQQKHQGRVDWQRIGGIALAGGFVGWTIAQLGSGQIVNSLTTAAKIAEFAKKPMTLLSEINMNDYLQK